MLCSACHDDTNGSCDYNGETDTCRFNQNSSSLDTADEIAAKTDFRANVTQLMEEAAELITALARYQNADENSDDAILSAADNVREEREDVEIMLRQLDVIFGRSKEWQHKKYEHLQAIVEDTEDD